jgi:hypothetical protein
MLAIKMQMLSPYGYSISTISNFQKNKLKNDEKIG